MASRATILTPPFDFWIRDTSPSKLTREIAYAMQQFPAKTAARRSIGIQFTMEPSVPPEKRTSFPSPAMVYVIVGIIVMAFVLFLILRPR